MAEGDTTTSHAFWNALYMGDVEAITEQLESEHVDLDQGDPDCGLETPLMRLCHTEIGEDDVAAILELMLMRSPDVNARDREGRTVLCHACMSGLTNVIRRLGGLAQCDPNLPDCYGNTALMFAVYYGDLHVLEALLASFGTNGPGVHISARNNEGITATMIAEQYQYHELADYLQQYLAWTIAAMEAAGPPDSSPDQPEDSPSEAQEEPHQAVGHKTQNFRRRKLKHALGPLVVQNKLQTSKSADYSKHHQLSRVSPEVSPRQYSYSAGAHQTHGPALVDKLYAQTEELLQQDYYGDSGDSSDDSETQQNAADTWSHDVNDDCDVVDIDDDNVFGDVKENKGPPVSRPRLNSNSLPDLTPTAPHPLNTYSALDHGTSNTSCRSDGYNCDSGYETRSSQCTVSREELLLPNLPEGGCESDTDYTPRTRRGSFSLPDLRGTRPSLVCRVNNSTPRLTELGSNSSTPRYDHRASSKEGTPTRANPGDKTSHHQQAPQHDDLKYIQDFINADYDNRDDDGNISSASDDELDCDETLKFSEKCTPRDIGLRLPALGTVGSMVGTPRTINNSAVDDLLNSVLKKPRRPKNVPTNNGPSKPDHPQVRKLNPAEARTVSKPNVTGANLTGLAISPLSSPMTNRRQPLSNLTGAIRTTGRPTHRPNILLEKED